MTEAEMKAELERLKAENESLKKQKEAHKRAAPALSMKVSKKGAVSVYGLGRWPVTLYSAQWEKLLGLKEPLLAFMKEHASELKTKGEGDDDDTKPEGEPVNDG